MVKVHPQLLPESNPDQAIIGYRENRETDEDGKIKATVTYTWFNGSSLELTERSALIPKQNIKADDLDEHRRRDRTGTMQIYGEDIGGDRFAEILHEAELDMDFYEQSGTTSLVELPIEDDQGDE